jgi:aryl-alcohol dehydrogenase-like predicted oxidoreductase
MAMDRVVISASLTSARIALGTGSLHHLRTPIERERLILTALDLGITHFDTSPYYGFGLAERALAVLSGSAPQTSIATKVGLYPPGGAEQPSAAVLARKVLGRFAPSLSRPIVDWSVARARGSLEESLRRLRRERVALLLLHEPNLELLATEEWQRWIESERDRIGTVGLSGEAMQLLPFVVQRHAFSRLIQTRDSLAGQEAAPLRSAGARPQLTFGHLARVEARADAQALLGRTVAQYLDTVLLLSTRRAERIADWVRGAEAAERIVRRSGAACDPAVGLSGRA